MWGLLDSGGHADAVGIERLALSCMDGTRPEIVGLGSSAGYDDFYCRKYPRVAICHGGAVEQPNVANVARHGIEGVLIKGYCQQDACPYWSIERRERVGETAAGYLIRSYERRWSDGRYDAPSRHKGGELVVSYVFCSTTNPSIFFKTPGTTFKYNLNAKPWTLLPIDPGVTPPSAGVSYWIEYFAICHDVITPAFDVTAAKSLGYREPLSPDRMAYMVARPEEILGGDENPALLELQQTAPFFARFDPPLNADKSPASAPPVNYRAVGVQTVADKFLDGSPIPIDVFVGHQNLKTLGVLRKMGSHSPLSLRIEAQGLTITILDNGFTEMTMGTELYASLELASANPQHNVLFGETQRVAIILRGDEKRLIIAPNSPVILPGWKIFNRRPNVFEGDKGPIVAEHGIEDVLVTGYCHQDYCPSFSVKRRERIGENSEGFLIKATERRWYTFFPGGRYDIPAMRNGGDARISYFFCSKRNPLLFVRTTSETFKRNAMAKQWFAIIVDPAEEPGGAGADSLIEYFAVCHDIIAPPLDISAGLKLGYKKTIRPSLDEKTLENPEEIVHADENPRVQETPAPLLPTFARTAATPPQKFALNPSSAPQVDQALAVVRIAQSLSPDASPEVLVRSIVNMHTRYPFVLTNFRPIEVISRYFTDGFIRAYTAASNKGGNCPFMDGDFLTSAQEGGPMVINSILSSEDSSHHYNVTVSFELDKQASYPYRIAVFQFLHEKGSWRIDNIVHRNDRTRSMSAQVIFDMRQYLTSFAATGCNG